MVQGVDSDNKRIIGLYGEMLFAMELHTGGWQVYRAYIDENIDFVIAKYFCKSCKKISHQKKIKKGGNNTGKNTQFPSNLCASCGEYKLKFLTRYIQVKTSEGKARKNGRDYSFHAKLRSNIGEYSYYTWIAVMEENGKKLPHYYIFHHTEIAKFDDLNLDSYQKTDNQKTTLRIDKAGRVLNKARIQGRSFECFNDDFYNNFDKLEPDGFC